MKHSLFLFSLLICFNFSCKEKDEKNGEDNKSASSISVHELAEPSMLNPITFSDAGAEEMCYFMFQKLLAIDYKTQELVPVLAEKRPEILKTPEGGLLITFRIRPEAKWDNGTQVTAKDVEFTLKATKCPLVNNEQTKSYFEYIKDFKFYDEDPLKFTIVYDRIYIRAEYNAGAEYFVIPQYKYDPENLLDSFHLIDFYTNENQEKLSKDEKIIKFAKNFNSPSFQREPDFISGSGPYALSDWKTGQKITFKKKKDWWGDQFQNLSNYFDAQLNQITYRLINDQTTAITAFKSGDIDLLYGLKAKDYVDIDQSEKLKGNIQKHQASLLNYSYVGINSQKPSLSGKATRKALAHLFDVDYVINKINYGYAVKVTGPTHPTKQKYYDTLLQPYALDIEKAKQLLASDGWKDSDNNGILDKITDGKKQN